MAYHKPTDIDGFVNQMSKADMRVKALLAEDLVAYLGDYENSIVSEDLGLLVDGLLPWLTGSHYKVNTLLAHIWFEYLMCDVRTDDQQLIYSYAPSMVAMAFLIPLLTYVISFIARMRIGMPNIVSFRTKREFYIFYIDPKCSQISKTTSCILL